MRNNQIHLRGFSAQHIASSMSQIFLAQMYNFLEKKLKREIKVNNVRLRIALLSAAILFVKVLLNIKQELNAILPARSKGVQSKQHFLSNT